MADLDVLEGKTLTGIEWDSEIVRFVWDGGDILFRAEGDCCSISWIDSFDGSRDILGSPIVKVTQLDLPDPEKGQCDCKHTEHCPHDVLALYGYRIETNSASATLDFRNDSNGYYGGYLVEEKTKGKR